MVLASMGQNVPDRDRLCTWVEADLAAWVRRQAGTNGYSTSAYLRLVLQRLRTEMLQQRSQAGKLGGTP